MAARALYFAVLLAWIAGLWLLLDFAGRPRQAPAAVPTTQLDWVTFFAENILPHLPMAEELVTPLRPPDGNGASVTLPFGVVGHLGEDWATTKGDGTLGEPVYSMGDGWVSVAQDFENAWGKVIFVCYRFPAGRYPPFIEVMYAQLQSIDVKPGDFVQRGQKIGTVGNAGGTYQAHLHWEVRQTVGLGVGPGFDTANRTGWLEPSQILTAHRGSRAKLPLQMKIVPETERKDWPSDY
jgi:murein DD-endopeptidase MepM/ murein hydrolase activator NlpD